MFKLATPSGGRLMLGTPDLLRLKSRLAQLVSIDTENPPGREVEAVRYLAGELAAIGLGVETQEIMPGRANVVARLANGPGPVFAFNSHIDVVPAGEGWSRPAFQLAESNGRLYGRGACDAKGPIAAMLEAIELLVAHRSAWSGDLLAVFVADEEAQSRGAKAFAAGKPHVDLAVIGEPTSNMVASAHKGSLRPRVRVIGKTAHSGMPHLGINAILEAGRLLGLVSEFHQQDIGLRTHTLVGNASITVTRIDGGHADNVIPDRCEFLIDRRLLPGESEMRAVAEIEELLATARDRYGVNAEIVGFAPTTGGATETSSEEPLVVAALTAAAASCRAHQEPVGFPAACDLVHFRSLGAKGIVLGPGSLDVAHKPDEFVPVDELVRASCIYAETALSMMKQGSVR